MNHISRIGRSNVSLRAIALALCLAGGFASSTASATPIANVGSGAMPTSGIVLADYKKDKFHYEPGSHHSKAPKHWHRYSHRPGDWHARGCIVVGPVWFCP